MYTFPLIGTADPPVPNRCEICGATFADKDLLKGHLLIHLEERPLPWEMHQIGIISRVIQPPTDIQKPIPVQPPALRDPKKRTVGVVHQTDGFMCDICGSHFTSLSGMTRHRQKHLNSEPPKDRKHRCTQCGYSTDNIANLVAHVRAHTGERPFRCEVCDKRFSRKNTLLSHQLVHSDERPFKCEVCGKSYKSERTLISHERKHAPFTCDVCGESFAFLRFLKSHEQRQHSKDTGKAAEDSSTKCDVCGQGFSSPSELQAHQPSCHLRDGSFQCPHCPFSTDVRGSLNAHVRRMHVGERRHPQDATSEKPTDSDCQKCYILEKEIAKLKHKVSKYKNKCMAMKGTESFVKIGPTVKVSRDQYSRCRTTNYSKFTGDLLEVIFGVDTLATHVLKGIRGCQKEDVLNQTVVAEIQSHVALKFEVALQQVRYAMRLKMNTAHKLGKRQEEKTCRQSQ